MGIRTKRNKQVSSFRKTASIAGERARYYNQGIMDKQAGREHRYRWWSPDWISSNKLSLYRAYNKGFAGMKL